MMQESDTDRLIRRLAAQGGGTASSARPGGLWPVLLLADAAGLAAVAGIVYFGLGWRGGETGWLTGAPFLLKLLIGAGLAGIGVQCCRKLMEPGRRLISRDILLWIVAVPLAALALLVLSGPALSQPAMPAAMGLACMLAITGLALLPMAMLLGALRKGAPTNLRLSGLLAGLTAGALTIIGYALHCPLDAAGMILFWYLGALAACAAIGALVGPRAIAW